MKFDIHTTSPVDIDPVFLGSYDFPAVPNIGDSVVILHSGCRQTLVIVDREFSLSSNPEDCSLDLYVDYEKVNGLP